MSAAQLACGIAGQAVALRRHRAYDVWVLGLRGRPDQVGRDSWLMGTALSAPVVMLAIQGLATARLAAGPSRAAARTLGLLGATMVGGYLVEKIGRARLTAQGADSLETPVVAAGLGLAAAMATLGAPPSGLGSGRLLGSR